MTFKALIASTLILLFASACEGVKIERLPDDQQPRSHDIPNI